MKRKLTNDELLASLKPTIITHEELIKMGFRVDNIPANNINEYENQDDEKFEDGTCGQTRMEQPPNGGSTQGGK